MLDPNSIKLYPNIQGDTNIQCILLKVDPIALQERISRFRNLDISKMSDQELDSNIYDVLCVDGFFSYLCNSGTYRKGTTFFRAKKLKGSTIPNERLSTLSDCWETPSTYLTNYGRLNKPHESLLYTCPEDVNLTIKEARISPDDYFVIVKYTAKEDIKVNIIGGDYDYAQHGISDKNAITVHEIYNSFLTEEFSRDVASGNECQYRISEMIAKHFFDLPPRIAQDAWAYKSVQDKSKYNVCFHPDIAHDLLQFNGAMVCKLDSEGKISVYCVAYTDQPNGPLQFFPVGSPQQKCLFPELIPPTHQP